MRHVQLSSAILLATSCMLVAAGCGKDASANPTGNESTPAAAKDDTAPKNDRMTDVDLSPLPLSISVPKGGMGAMDMSVGDHKSVTVDIGGGTSLNIRPLGKGGVKELKSSFEKDTILHPFKKYAKEGDDTFVVEFEVEGKSGFVGVAVHEVAGKKYVCKTTGLNGVKTAELAEKQLAACSRLEAK